MTLLTTSVVVLVPPTTALPFAAGFWDVRTFPRVWAHVLALP